MAFPGNKSLVLRLLPPNNRFTENIMSLTKSQIVEALAEKTGVEKKTAEAMLDGLAQLAYANAKDEFTVPGIGKLIMVDQKARTARNPATGATIQIPARKALKFRVAKAAKDAILGAVTPVTSSPTTPPTPASQAPSLPSASS
jgi:DNA-binding protein HU-beta